MGDVHLSLGFIVSKKGGGGDLRGSGGVAEHKLDKM